MEKLTLKNWTAILALYAFGAFAIVASAMEVPASGDRLAVFFLPGSNTLAAAHEFEADLITVGTNQNVQVLQFHRDVSLGELWRAGAVLVVDMNVLIGCGFLSGAEAQSLILDNSTEA